MLSHIETAGRTIRIHMPPRRLSAKLLIVLAPLALFDVVFLVLLFSFLKEPGGPPRALIFVFVGLFLVVPIVVVASFLVKAARGASTVEASPEVLRVSFRSGGREKVVEIPSKSLEDLDIAKAREMPAAGGRGAGFPIVARSDQARVAFGEHLPEAEKAWILQVLRQVLTA